MALNLRNKEQHKEEGPPQGPSGGNVPTNFENIVSTGSTLLDLAISGGRLHEGGIPGGIIVEIYGPSGAGKSAILSELSASTQARGGHVKFLDPEARLDQEYTKIYGVSLSHHFEYSRPDTVSQLFSEEIFNWDPPNNNFLNMIAADSLAALSTKMEMDEADKMGMRRAKEFSEGLRKTCRIIANNNWLIACSNQIRTGDGGKEVTPGGHGIPFYSSLRIRIKPDHTGAKILKKKKFGKVEVEKVIGVQSICTITKSSVDDPWRVAPISIIFGYGVDTIRDELAYHKKLRGLTSYDAFDKTFVGLDHAVAHIEDKGYQTKTKERTIELWNEVERTFQTNRPAKTRK